MSLLDTWFKFLEGPKDAQIVRRALAQTAVSNKQAKQATENSEAVRRKYFNGASINDVLDGMSRDMQRE